MRNGFFQLGWYDLGKGLALAVVTALLVALYNIVIVNGFDFFTVDWLVVGRSMANLAGVTIVSYLFTNLLSTNRGSVLGITPNHDSLG